jgi:hypothetical protein
VKIRRPEARVLVVEKGFGSIRQKFKNLPHFFFFSAFTLHFTIGNYSHQSEHAVRTLRTSLQRSTTMNIRKMTIAAIVAFSATTAAFASNYTIDPNSVDPATINAWVQLNVNDSATASANVNLSSLSIADQFRVPNKSADELNMLYKVVSVDGTTGLNVALDTDDFTYCTELVKGTDGQQLRFNFLVSYDQGVSYGAHAVKVTLENTETHEQTSVLLMVTVN